MKKKTHEEYVKQIAVVNPNIDVVGTYINSRTKVIYQCKVCDYTWEAFPDNIVQGHGCPMCANAKRAQAHVFTLSDYINKLLLVNPDIEFIGDYKNSCTKALHRCKLCGNEWMAYPNNVLKGKGCKKCFDKKNADNLKKSHDVYVGQVNNINDNIVVLGEYVNSRMPILHKCKICGYEWDISPDNVLRGHGCPKCIESRGEKLIEEYLMKHLINFERQYTFSDCRNKKPLPFDFYIPGRNLCIEYDGIQHFEPVKHFGGVDKFKQRQYNDNIKTSYCLLHNIDLLRIKYNQNVDDELDNFFNNTRLIEEAI